MAARRAGLAAMTERMRARGPDAGGTFLQDRVAFGHRRLGIIDLAAASQQPMVDPELASRSCSTAASTIIGSCASNCSKGLSIFSQGDTEVISRPMRVGPALRRAFNGMFAFAIWERDSGRSCWRETGSASSRSTIRARPGPFRFASTLPALLAAGDVETSIDPGRSITT